MVQLFIVFGPHTLAHIHNATARALLYYTSLHLYNMYEYVNTYSSMYVISQKVKLYMSTFMWQSSVCAAIFCV